MAKKKKHAGHENLERWLVSYADFMTLLFAVFVVLYSFAMAKSVDAQSMIKGLMASFSEMGMVSAVPGVIALPGPVANLMADASLASAAAQKGEVQTEAPGGGGVMDFGVTQQSLEDAGAMEQTANSDENAEAVTQGNLEASEVIEPTQGTLTNVTPDSQTDKSSGMTEGGKLDEVSEGGVGPAESEFEGENPSGQPFDTLMRSISETISEQGLSNEVIVEHDPNWITINISSTMLFAPNSSSILTRSRPVIASIANTLKSVNNYIRVRGYTDNSFVPSAIYGNNWELSSRRAINVLQELEANGIDPQRLAAEAYGQYSPFYSNATRAGRAQNRRVVIAISREALKNQNLQVVPGSSENMIPTRRAGSGGFNFEANPDGSVSFKAEPIDQDVGVMEEEAPPAEGDAGAGRVELPNFGPQN